MTVSATLSLDDYVGQGNKEQLASSNEAWLFVGMLLVEFLPAVVDIMVI